MESRTQDAIESLENAAIGAEVTAGAAAEALTPVNFPKKSGKTPVFRGVFCFVAERSWVAPVRVVYVSRKWQ